MLFTVMSIVVGIIHKYKDTFFDLFLSRQLSGVKSIIDVGCGSSSPLGRIGNNSFKVGIDLFVPSLKKSKEKKVHNRYIKGDIMKLNNIFDNNSFECVIALDVIEHFTKKDGLRLMRSMESVASKKVIIFTPNGFVRQSAFENNKHQVHKSGWSVEDFERHGYTVYGFRGLRNLRGEFASIKYRPWFLWGFIAFITEPLLFMLPRYSYHLFAVKNLNDE